jgi:hypothetical protein
MFELRARFEPKTLFLKLSPFINLKLKTREA